MEFVHHCEFFRGANFNIDSPLGKETGAPVENPGATLMSLKTNQDYTQQVALENKPIKYRLVPYV